MDVVASVTVDDMTRSSSTSMSRERAEQIGEDSDWMTTRQPNVLPSHPLRVELLTGFTKTSIPS